MDNSRALEVLKHQLACEKEDGCVGDGYCEECQHNISDEDWIAALNVAISALEKQEQSYETCKHGQFGDEAYINCRVGFPNHYEAEGKGMTERKAIEWFENRIAVMPESETKEMFRVAISALEFRENYRVFWEEVKAAGMKGKEVEIRQSGRVFKIREVAQ